MNKLNFLNPVWFKQRAITAYDPCVEDAGAFTAAADCLEEGSRIIGLMLVKQGTDVETLIDSVSIDAAVTAGDVAIITKVTGSWPKPTVNKKPGLGFKVQKFTSLTYAIPFKHEGVDANLKFWNDINQSDDWSVVFVFEDFSSWCALKRDKSLIAMDIEAAPSAPEELGQSRMIEGTANWTHKDLPYQLNTLPAAVASSYFNH